MGPIWTPKVQKIIINHIKIGHFSHIMAIRAISPIHWIKFLMKKKSHKKRSIFLHSVVLVAVLINWHRCKRRINRQDRDSFGPSVVLLDTDVGLEIGTILYGSSADCPLYSTASLYQVLKVGLHTKKSFAASIVGSWMCNVQNVWKMTQIRWYFYTFSLTFGDQISQHILIQEPMND